MASSYNTPPADYIVPLNNADAGSRSVPVGAQRPQKGPYQHYGAGTSAMGPQSGTGADMEAQAFEQSTRSGGAAEGSWNPMHIDWGFVIKSQHYGTAVFTIAYLIILACVHWLADSRGRPIFLYDASIAYPLQDDTIPAVAAVLVPFALLIISMLAYEFFVYRKENYHITNAVATFCHFLLDAVCAFVCVVMVTEITKFAAGRLRPDFLSACDPIPGFQSGPAELGASSLTVCRNSDPDGRKSFCSGHASSSAVTTVYNIVYLIWSGYVRGGDAAFLGLDVKTGWRGGRRVLREMGHGFYIFWIMLNFGWIWTVGITRFTDYKHHMSDVLGGWFLGTAFGLIYCVRAAALHKYVIIHDLHMFRKATRREVWRSADTPKAPAQVEAS